MPRPMRNGALERNPPGRRYTDTRSIRMCPDALDDGRPEVSFCSTQCSGTDGTDEVVEPLFPSTASVILPGVHSIVAVCQPALCWVAESNQ